MKRILARFGPIVLISALMCGAAAGTANAYLNTNSSYNTTVGKFDGNGYTGYDQKKEIPFEDAYIYSRYVGGNYQVDVRVDHLLSSWRRINDNTSRDLPNWINKGNYVRLRFSNDRFTPVNVQVSGYWRSR